MEEIVAQHEHDGYWSVLIGGLCAWYELSEVDAMHDLE